MSMKTFNCDLIKSDSFHCAIDLAEPFFLDGSVTDWLSAIGTVALALAAIILLPHQLNLKEKKEKAEAEAKLSMTQLALYQGYHRFMASEDGIVFPEYTEATPEQRLIISRRVAAMTGAEPFVVLQNLELMREQGKI